MDRPQSSNTELLVWLFLFGVLFTFICTLRYVHCANQAAVWQREGIEISTWEAFCGAQPAQRLIEVK